MLKLLKIHFLLYNGKMTKSHVTVGLQWDKTFVSRQRQILLEMVTKSFAYWSSKINVPVKM